MVREERGLDEGAVREGGREGARESIDNQRNSEKGERT